MRYFFTIIAVLLALDAFCFFLWVFSGQTPVDGFYAGTITAHVLGLFF